jgi:hypothetical protein
MQLDGAVAFASAVAWAALDFHSHIRADAGLSGQVGPVRDRPVCEREMTCPSFAAPAPPTAKVHPLCLRACRFAPRSPRPGSVLD